MDVPRDSRGYRDSDDRDSDVWDSSGWAVIANVAVAALGATSMVVLWVTQLSDGAFCTGARQVAGLAVLAAQTLLAALALHWWARVTRRSLT